MWAACVYYICWVASEKKLTKGTSDVLSQAELGGKLYIICNKMHGGAGDGGLYRVDPKKPRNDDQVIGGWEDVQFSRSNHLEGRLSR
jgi:hypothetical protein